MSENTNARALWPWLLLGLFAHTGWGAYPVLSRYLQTVSQLPSLSLLAAGNLVVLLAVATAVLPRLDKSYFKLPLLWGFGAIVVARGVTNLLAARFTLSIYVQLINQMTPFVVAVISLVLLREKLPRYTGRAITLCLGGAVLMMSGNLGQAATATAVSRQDALGITLAVASTVFLAIYMILVRRTATKAIPAQALLIVHLVSLFTFSATTSLILGEDLARWTQLGVNDWLVFAAFSLGVLLLSNLAQLNAIGTLGAPMMSSMMAWRLVSALVVGALLLNERLTSLWQLLGALVVLVTITWYLRQQR